jgi:hypothetical protein
LAIQAAAPSGLPLSALSVDTTEHQKLHDLIVIGAGPHALAVVARLLEKRPSALYTDLEHARLSWLRKYRTSRRTTKRTLVQGHGHKWRPDIVVLDKHGRGGWMPRWKTLFAQLHIATLRSPLFFHPYVTLYAVEQLEMLNINWMSTVARQMWMDCLRMLIRTSVEAS